KNDTSTTSAELTASGSSRKTFEAGIGSTNDVQSSGKVTSYEVLSQACTDKGCEVQLSVSVEKLEFKSKTAGIERDSIAVVTTGRLRNGKTATQLREAITDKLVKSGRFTVLDRSNDAVFDKELGLLDSE